VVPVSEVVETAIAELSLVPETVVSAATPEHREHERHERERHEHRERREPREHREPRERHAAAPLPEISHAVPAEIPAEPAADRGKRRDKRASAPTAETREFWETWAETKSTRDAPPLAAEPARSAEASGDADAADAEPARRGRGDRGGRGRGGRDKRETTQERPARGKKDDDHGADNGESKRADGRGKRDTVVTPIAASDGGQARLFVSLGKKHGVTADDLRTLLAGPVGGDTSRIGSVSLRDSHAHVRVPEELVETIITGVHGKLHNEHNVTVERSRA
jgi:hypothetical protein